MAIINTDKPNVGSPETYLEIGSGFNLLIGGIYKLIIGAAGLAGMTNVSKVSIGETWSTITTTWATETQTWEEASQLITNIGIVANIWDSRTLPWTSSAPWLLVGGGMTNINKP